MSKNTYECEICWNVNHNKHGHCSTCGTIPKQYSILREPARICGESINMLIPVKVAIGCDRTERHRTCKRVLRTVPADYYACPD